MDSNIHNRIHIKRRNCVAPSNPTTYTVVSGAITLTNPTRVGYTFAGWTGTDLGSISTIVTIPTGSTGNRAYTANWLSKIYTITYNLDGGTVSPENPATYTIGSDEIILNSPTRIGYTFTGWTGSNGEIPAEVTIPVGSTGNRAYTANWRLENEVIITATAGSNGTISPIGAITINKGSNQTYIIVADEGYTIDELRVDGVLVAMTGCYVFNNILSDRTIEVTFKEEPSEVLESYGLRKNLGGASAITSMNGGETVSLQYVPKEGVTFVEWIVNYGGISIADPTSNTITFTMPSKPVEITVKVQ